MKAYDPRWGDRRWRFTWYADPEPPTPRVRVNGAVIGTLHIFGTPVGSGQFKVERTYHLFRRRRGRRMAGK